VPAAQPEGPPPPPTVQRLRVRYARRGRLRFTSHRDVARVLERALRRADVPIAFSAGFSPHPKLSYVGACPTGVASEAEYLELGLAVACEPVAVLTALDAALPPGLDVLEVVEAAPGEPSLPDRIDASRWRIRLPGVGVETVANALAAFLAAGAVPVQRRTKEGFRDVDARGAVASAAVGPDVSVPSPGGVCARIDLVVRHATPAVRPDDVLAGLRRVADLEPAAPPEATRLAQGHLAEDGELLDPLAPYGLARGSSRPDAPPVSPASTDFPAATAAGPTRSAPAL